MRRPGLLVLTLLLTVAAGCRARSSVAPGDGEAEAEAGAGGGAWPVVPAEGFAVLPWGTQVFLEPRVGGPSVRLGWPFVSPPPWPTAGHVVRVLGQRDGLVEIAPLSLGGPPHCGPMLDGEAFDVRLYVSPWSLASVLTRPFEEVDDAGRLLALRPGAVVQRFPHDADGGWAVSAAGLLVRARLPDDAVGITYAGPEPLEMPPSRPWQLLPDPRWTHDGWPVAIEQMLGADATIASVVPDEQGYRLELVSPCAKVTVRAAVEPPPWPEVIDFEFGLGAPDEEMPEDARIEALIEPEPPLDGPPDFGSVEGGILGTLQGGSPFFPISTRPEWVFEQGAPVYLSPAGGAAGTLKDLRIFSEDGWTTGERLCFHTSFGARFSPPLAVCLDGAEGRLRNPTEDAHDFQAGLVRPGPIAVTGALDQAAVERALRGHRHELRRCVFSAQQQGRLVPGELALALELSGTGRVTHARLRSTPTEWVRECVVEAAAGWTLPAPADAKPARVELSVRIGDS